MRKAIALLLTLTMLMSTGICGVFAADTEPFNVTYTTQGSAEKNFRFVVPLSDIPFSVTENSMTGMRITGVFTEKATGTETTLDSVIIANEMRTDATVLVVPGTAEVPAKDYDNDKKKTHTISLTVYPGEIKDVDDSPTTPPTSSGATLVSQNGNMDFQGGMVYFVLLPDMFSSDTKGWIVTNDNSNSYRSEILFAQRGSSAGSTQAAFEVGVEGTYYIWVHSRDFAEGGGSRSFHIEVDGKDLGKTANHAKEGWAWNTAIAVDLTKGSHTLALNQGGQFCRMDQILITNDKDFIPKNTVEDLETLEKEYTFDPDNVVVPTPTPAPTPDPNRPDDDVVVKFNGEYMTFEVPPQIINDRTMVPMRAIFEALGAEVMWNPDNETATGFKNGTRVSATIGSNTAMIDKTAVEIDQPPVIVDDRTLVPLRFISEAYGSDVEWIEETRTVVIEAETKESTQMFNLAPVTFENLGTWVLSGTYLQGLATGSTIDEASGTGSVDATKTIYVETPGEYTVWARSRDYATNQPGTRTYHVAVDGTRLDKKLGAHGQNGFAWEKVGTVDLTEGEHVVALQDTSGFYARCEGVFLSADPDFVPMDDLEELASICAPGDRLEGLPSAFFPGWANEEITDIKSDSIENDTVKVTFYQGNGRRGPVVQNEISIKVDGQWVPVKARNEELGFLMLKAKNSEMAGDEAGSISADIANLSVKLKQTITIDGEDITGMIDEYYRSGIPVWFIPSDFQKTEDGKIVLYFNNDEADLTVTYELDDLTDDPKVTLNAGFKEPGAYSFVLSSGGEMKEEDYEQVTAPLLFVKKYIPEYDLAYNETYMFTPMATFTLPETNTKVSGKKFTTGIAIDPTCIPQDFAYPKTSRFGVLLRTPTNRIRGQFVAPLYSTDNCTFQAGDTYSISYRIINRAEDWYDTYCHVSEDMYKLADLRTNYFHSINEAIYNVTDLLMDDFYGGWDPKDKGFYNMEAQEVSSQSNVMEMMQRYLLTENEEILEKRVIPTIAFLMSRTSAHFKRTEGDLSNYVTNAPSNMNGPMTAYPTSVYGGLYQMSQGRMPFLLDQAVTNINETNNLPGITAQAALYEYTGDESYRQKVVEAADKYLESTLNSDEYMGKAFNNGFVFGDYAPLVTSFLAAYEATGEQKYLDAAEEAGRLLVTSLWTTGYQNDYATNEYTIDPEKTAERIIHADRKNFNWWWHGSYQWRLGNEVGVTQPPQEGSQVPLQEETVPGWLPAKTGLGTEHPGTASHGNYVYMNSWAGMLVKLSEYTGDPYFQMQARNAMVGRFGNYAGYYQDRYIVHQMREDYPYVGPDYTLIYWHHIPVFAAILEDYLINSVWAKTNRNVEFPSVYQSGYAYFVSNQYGFAPGKFFDEDEMWLWLDRGIVQPDSVEIDYITAKKDGKLGVAMVNEGNAERTTTVTLGEKVPGGASYNGTAVLYDADGNKSEIPVTNGAFTVTIPSKGSMSVLLSIDGITKPAYANDNFVFSNAPGETVAQHTRGKAYAMQVDPSHYYAYVYITDMPDQASKMTVNYEVGGEKKVEEITEYPFETIVKVEDPADAFTYTVTVTKTDGTTEDLGGGTLRPMTDGAEKQDIKIGGYLAPSISEKFTPFSPKVTGIGELNGLVRFVVETKDFPFEVQENLLKGLKVKVVLTSMGTDGSVMVLDSVIAGNEMRDGTTVLKVNPTDEVPAKDYRTTHSAVLMIFNPDDDTSSVKLPGEPE